jgi:hypothetical protein
MSCSAERANALFEKALAKGLIERRGAYYYYGGKNLGHSKDDATGVIINDDEMINQLGLNLSENTPSKIEVRDSPRSSEDIENLGVRKHTLTKTAPTTHEVNGQAVTEIMETTITEFLEQPIIGVTEAKMLAVAREDWHPYKYSTRIGDKHFEPGELMTVVPKTGRWRQRRFMMLKDEWSNL